MTTRTKDPWQVNIRTRYFAFEHTRGMVPVAELRNPLAGLHHVKLRIGRLGITWD